MISLRTSKNLTEDNQYFVSARYLRLAAQAIGIEDHSIPELLKGTGIHRENFFEDGYKASLGQQVVFTRNMIDFVGEESIGLRVGRRYTPETHGPIGLLICSSANVYEALDNFKKYLPSIFPLLNLSFEDRGDKYAILIEHVLPLNEDRLIRPLIESTAQCICAVINSATGGGAKNVQLHTTYPKPTYDAHYKEYFSRPVEFSSQENGLIIDKTLALTSNPIASKENYNLALDYCHRLIPGFPENCQSIIDLTRGILRSGPPGSVTESTVARQLHTSSRTLSRRLKEHNTSFVTLRDEILAEIAAMQLRNPSKSIESIALNLDYHDAANFTRAFKRWYGLTPAAYRKKLLE